MVERNMFKKEEQQRKFETGPECSFCNKEIKKNQATVRVHGVKYHQSCYDSWPGV